MDRIFFDDWFGIIRTGVIGVLAYMLLILFLRLSGKRTLSKMNAFDLIVTVALGSTLATVLLNRDVALSEGAMGMALLIGLQFVVTWSSVRVRWVRRLATGEPRLLVFQGELLAPAMRRARVTQDEIHAAMRHAGIPTIQQVGAVVLETNGTFSVIHRTDAPQITSLTGVESSVFEREVLASTGRR